MRYRLGSAQQNPNTQSPENRMTYVRHPHEACEKLIDFVLKMKQNNCVKINKDTLIFRIQTIIKTWICFQEMV